MKIRYLRTEIFSLVSQLQNKSLPPCCDYSENLDSRVIVDEIM